MKALRDSGRARRRLLRRPSPAMVIALIALFAATAGSALAGHGGRHGPAGLVNSLDVQNGSLTGADVKNRSLRPIDFRGSIRGPRGPAGQNGVNGTNGQNSTVPGPPGSASTVPGPPGPVALDYNVSATFTNPGNTQSFADVNCDAGQRATGGGAFGSAGLTQSVNSSFPLDSDTWRAYMNNNSATSATFNVFVICTSATAISGPTGSANQSK